MPESAAGSNTAGYSPKSFYFVNLFPSGTKFGPGSGKSQPMHFLSRPRIGQNSDSFCVMNFMTNSPVCPSVQKEILLHREFPPPGLAGKSCTGQFSFISYSIFLHFPTHFPSKLKILKIDFFTPDGILYTIFPSNFSLLA
jgi:hypothetical protein